MLRALPAGGTVGVVAPAAPVHNRSDVLRGTAFWEHHGFCVKLSDSLFHRSGYFAGDARFHGRSHFDVPRSRDRRRPGPLGRIGLDCDDPLPRLDRDRCQLEAFVGRSDITSLHLAFARYAKYPTFTVLDSQHRPG